MSEDAADRGPVSSSAAHKKALRLEYVTVAWNSTEAVITLVLGVIAKSWALIAFGLDSLIELFASGVVIWHMRDEDAARHIGRTRRALRLVAVAFFALAVFLTVMSIRNLAVGNRPEESPIGIAYIAVTAIVMFVLARLKGVVAKEIGAGPMAAEAHLSYLDGFLASAVLVALVLNATLDWWWADSIAALVVAAFAFTEGWEHWEESSE
jgi:divalent metal cation (Fe/Co/Zn/Cd) transporter